MGGVYTAGYGLLARTPGTHYLADNKLFSSESVFFLMISFVSASKIAFDLMSSTDSYSDICYLGTDELIIFVSFL